MTDITRIPPPPSTPPELRAWWQTVATQILAQIDARFSEWAGAAGLIANADGTVTVKSGAGIDGRSGSSLPTIVSKIANTGRANNQGLLTTVGIFNRQSAQNANPLTSTSDASTATITIASHTVKWGGETTSYTGGTITGAPVNTVVFVYADDAELAGGSVTYSYTTDPQVAVGAEARYYVGAIETAKNAATANISNATQANPCVITTSAAHGYDTGDSVLITGVVGMTALNGNTYAITKINATSFSLDGVNSTGYGAYVSGGTTTRANTTAGTGGLGGGFDWNGALP